MENSQRGENTNIEIENGKVFLSQICKFMSTISKDDENILPCFCHASLANITWTELQQLRGNRALEVLHMFENYIKNGK